MQIQDISWPLSPETTTYKNKQSLEYKLTRSFEHDNMQESLVSLGNHTGTHIDAPRHFIQNGKTIEQTDLKNLIVPCQVVDLMHVHEKITAHDLETFNLKPKHAILLKTSNSLLPPTGPFEPNFVYLDASGAEYLATKNIVSVGIDYLGIERNSPEHATHTLLFNADITIIEGLRLAHIEPGDYTLICLPLLLQNSEAAPARAVLLKALTL